MIIYLIMISIVLPWNFAFMTKEKDEFNKSIYVFFIADILINLRTTFYN